MKRWPRRRRVTPLYDGGHGGQHFEVWARSGYELRPSFRDVFDNAADACVEAERLWQLSGEDRLYSVWVQCGEAIVWAKGEKRDDLLDRAEART